MNENLKKQFYNENGVEIDKIDKELFTRRLDDDTTKSEIILSKPYSYWKSVNKILWKSPSFIIATLILITFLVLVLVIPGVEAAPQLNPDGSLQLNNPIHGPTWDHLFGISQTGQDYWNEIWSGARTTFLFSLVVAFIQLTIGIFLGFIWGYFRKTDLFFIQLTNLLTVIPILIMLLFVIFIFGQTGLIPVLVGISIQMWIGMASTIRSQIILVRNSDYNVASITLGSKPRKIITKNIAPKILPVIVQIGSFSIPFAIGLDATLTFLNFGFVDGVKTTSLGFIINKVTSQTVWQTYPHLLIIPIFFVVILSLVFFVIAKVFADALDPKGHK